MLFANILSTAAIAAFSATKVATVEHGDVTAYDGVEVKWQQLGERIWTGIPVDEWNEDGEFSYVRYWFRFELTSATSA